MKQMNLRYGRRGFTLTEVIIVLAIIAILAAAATPALFSMIENGRHMNRMNIARTVYLAAQNRLTEMRVLGRLDGFVQDAQDNWGDYFGRVARPGVALPPGDAGNVNDIYFIGLPASGGRDNPVAALLAPVLTYQEVLNHAIVIEFNVVTGVVLSVFYSDTQPFLGYTGSGGTEDISGVRGMGPGGYEGEHARDRRQGFFGVGYTGRLPDDPELNRNVWVSLFDSYVDGPPAGYPALGGNRHNILYAKIFIPRDAALLELNPQFNVNINGVAQDSFRLSDGLGSAFVPNGRYRADTAEYIVVVWILDYVSYPFNPANSVSRFNPAPDVPIRVGVDVVDNAAVSNPRHPFFSTQGSGAGTFAIRSARHVHNIRYASLRDTDSNPLSAVYTFTMARHIDLNDGTHSSIGNFTPIPHFRGTFDGGGFTLSGLRVENTGNAGLFDALLFTPRFNTRATVRNLVLYAPEIVGGTGYAGNAGAVAGISGGLVAGVQVINPVVAGRIAGGIVGHNENGVVRDTVLVSDSRHTPVYGTTQAGGMVGFSLNGTLERLLMLAVAPGDAYEIFPIVGYWAYLDAAAPTATVLDSLLYLHGTALRPRPIPPGASLPFNAAPRVYGRPVGTLDVRAIAGGWPGWAPSAVTDENAMDIDRFEADADYPYPIALSLRIREGTLAAGGEGRWPVTLAQAKGDIGFDNIVYFERAENGGAASYGFYHPGASALPPLRSGAQYSVARAGYMLVVDIDALGEEIAHITDLDGLRLWARPVSGDVWTELLDYTALELGHAGLDGLYAAELPLEAFADIVTGQSDGRYIPLEIGFNFSATGTGMTALGYVHPYFAQALFSTPDPDEFVIRTLWQMQNISHLTYTGETAGLTFRQTRTMDYARDGQPAPGLDGRNAVVTGVFAGNFYGHSLENSDAPYRISNVAISGTANAGVFESNAGRIQDIIIENPRIFSQVGNAGGLVGENTGHLARIVVQSPTVRSLTGNAGGIIGLHGGGSARILYVRYEEGRLPQSNNAPDYRITGIRAGGIAGMSNAPIAQATFQSVAALPHVTGTVTGGMVGLAGGAGTMAHFLMLAPAPATLGQLRPIVGEHSGHPPGLTLFYLSGIAIRPVVVEYNPAPPEGETRIGQGLDTLGIMEHIQGPEWSGFWETSELLNDPATQAMLALSLDNPVNPYPQPLGTNAYDRTGTPDTPWQWPIAVSGSIYLRNIYYFEEYDSGTFGLYISPAVGGILDRPPPLQGDRPVTRAGYAVVLMRPEAPPPTLGVYARPAGAGDAAWVRIPTHGGFAPGGYGVAHGSGAARFWVASLNLDALIQAFGTDGDLTRPLELTYGHVGGVPSEESFGYLHPFFARGQTLDYTRPGTDGAHAYLVRTPWQLQNISRMTAAGHTQGVYFRQNRDMRLDRDTGPGAGFIPTNPDTPVNAVVRGIFHGTYDGAFYRIDNATLAPPGDTDLPTGLFAHNAGLIERVIVRHSTFAGNENVGAVAGHNDGYIERSGVENTTVSGTNRVGGFAGTNTGEVSDVYFLSLNARLEIPVQGTATGAARAVGGIVGHNAQDALVTHAFYLAPAPRVVENGNYFFNPIVGAGEEAKIVEVSDGFPYFIGVDGEIIREVATTFFLRGHQHALTGGAPGADRWISGPAHGHYNRFRGDRDELGRPTHEIRLGGSGQITYLLQLDWMEFIYQSNLENWRQVFGFPYPVLYGSRPPELWPMTHSPPRPEQVDSDDWAPWDVLTDRALAPELVNPNFAMPLAHPADWRASGRPGASGDTRRIYVDMDHVPGWFTRPVLPGDFTAGTYAGWPRWRLMELQEPINHDRAMFHDYAYSNFEGRFNNPNNVVISPFRYAELNAETAGTLYQVIPTTAGAQFYYSFFHTTRTQGAGQIRADRMHFYLTPFTAHDGPGGLIPVENAPALAARDGIMRLIRPAVTPRMTRTGTGTAVGTGVVPAGAARNANATAWNPLAWNTVAYGRANYPHADVNQRFNLAHHRGRAYLQPFDGAERVQNIPANGQVYLYDVWVGPPVAGTGNERHRPDGFGITFWSPTPLTLGTATGDNMIYFFDRRWNQAAFALRDVRIDINLPAPTAAIPNRVFQMDNLGNGWWSIPNPIPPGTPGATISSFQISGVRGTGAGTVIHLPRNTAVATSFATNNFIAGNNTDTAALTRQTHAAFSNWGPAHSGTAAINAARLNMPAATRPGGDAVIPLEGITQAQFLTGGWAWLAHARTNVIGFWGVEHGWRHFYGAYEISPGQTMTEFAFQSRRPDSHNGNFLDNISLRSPAFLSVDKHVRDASGSDARFVKPGDVLHASVHIRNWGEVPADRIVVRSPLYPFNQYVYPINPASVTITRGTGEPVTGATFTGTTDDEFVVNLPPGTTLELNEVIIITYEIRVRYVVPLDEPVSTLLFFFRTQATVTFREDSQNRALMMTAFQNREFSNASEVLQIFIDPIRLDQWVETYGFTGAPGDDPLVGNQFNVTLRVTDTTFEETDVSSIRTAGLISINLPYGFVVSDRGTLPEYALITLNVDGTYRIVIRNANLGPLNRYLAFTYTLQYVGDGFGVSYVSLEAEYRYLFMDDATTDPVPVMLSFPQPVVGIRPQPVQEVEVGVARGGFRVLHMEELGGLRTKLMDDGGYDVISHIIEVWNADGTRASLDVNQNQHITVGTGNAVFSAVLTPGNNLEMTMGPDVPLGTRFNFFFRVNLVATREGAMSFDLSSGLIPIHVYAVDDTTQ
ncbi:MAG: prepilin-type N-terminal cleavage/methylation domain-containing protein [Defluviitaleaceae bacterium]|nr:prepilin-type N-terminal cleavage/methylation domain-containing protein [Defluviitaleaceae bacterium]